VVQIYKSNKVVGQGLGVNEKYRGTKGTQVVQWCRGAGVVKI
jgi:hypothetical protein